jgi:hypothetical protein
LFGAWRDTIFFVNLVVAALLAAAATVSPPSRAWPPRRQAMVSSLFALVALVDAVLLISFVFGEDDYRGNGITRWDAYRSPGGALGPMFVASVALLVVAAGLLVVAGARGRRRLFGATALAASLGCVFLVSATILGFSLN